MGKKRDVFMKVRTWIKSKQFMLSNRCKLICFSIDGKKYLAVLCTGWRGIKVRRKFEVVSEVDDNLKPIIEEWPVATKI